MSFLVKTSKIRQISSILRPVSFSAKRYFYNYDDYKPGPYPKTQAEREAAAKKYNLLPSEYEPYPDNEESRGDYPKLPDVGVEDRDPYYPWDNPALRRNFGEPVHARIDLIGEDRWNISFRPRYSPAVMIGSFLGVMTFFYVTYYLLLPYPFFHPVMEKQYPSSGRVHYTFEPADSSDQEVISIDASTTSEDELEEATE